MYTIFFLFESGGWNHWTQRKIWKKISPCCASHECGCVMLKHFEYFTKLQDLMMFNKCLSAADSLHQFHFPNMNGCRTYNYHPRHKVNYKTELVSRIKIDLRKVRVWRLYGVIICILAQLAYIHFLTLHNWCPYRVH